ncbi:MAG: hypothetical protein AAF726_20325 [Planctomycetota bacterium]
MSKYGTARATQAKAYGKQGGGGGPISRLAAMGLVLVGFTVAALAVATAVMPVAPEQMRPVLEGIDRLGLDKGPLAFFGAIMIGVGLALNRIASVQGGSKTAARAASFAEQNAGELEGMSAILGALQGELGALRHELSEVRVEIEMAKTPTTGSGGETANDPIFRLAASLDQLGARVDKRIEATRSELIDAVETMSKTISDVTKEQTEAAREQRTEFEGLRMDMVDLHAEIARVTEDVTETKAAVASAKSQAAAAPAARPIPQAQPSSALPRELTEPRAPLSVGESASQEKTAAADAPTASDSDEPDEFEFPSPPPPIPTASEGLDLLDDMEVDRARDGDQAPPLFPDLDGNSPY